MKYKLSICAVVLLAATVSSGTSRLSRTHHSFATSQAGSSGAGDGDNRQAVAKVNGAVLTDRDLQREMFSIFPYARQHNGNIPQEMEPQIRNGAMQMIIFEELVYQEAQRRKITISARAAKPRRSRLSQAVFQSRRIQQFCTS